MKKIGFAIGGVLGVWGLLLICVKSYASQYTFQALKRAPIVPVGIIFGAGYKQNGEPSKYLKDRLDTGIALFRAGKIKKLLLSGDNGVASHDELDVMKRYCKAKNIDSTKVFVDYAGFDTYSTLYRAKHVFKIDQALLVSQNYHLDRAVFTGRILGLHCYGISSDKGHYKGYRQNFLREQAAIINAFIELITNRKPAFLGKTVNINGPSNFHRP